MFNTRFSNMFLSTELEYEDVELPLRQSLCYIRYEISVEVYIEPGGGDGWNEPRYDASAEIYDSEVLSVLVVDEDGNEWEYDEKFIGPMEPGVVQPNHGIDLTSKECKIIEELALDQRYEV